MAANPKSVFLFVLILGALACAHAPSSVLAQDSGGPLPVHLQAKGILVDAPVEQLQIADAMLPSPTGLWTAGLVGNGERLDQPGLNVFFAIAQFTNAGDGTFYYLDQSVPGQVITVTGSDGLAYDYTVVSNDLLPADNVIQSAFTPPSEATTWILLLGWARYDPNIGDSPGFVAVKAVREAGAAPEGAPTLSTPEFGPVPCTDLGFLPQQTWYGSIPQMQVFSGEIVDQTITSNLTAAMNSVAPSCDIEIKTAVQLADGNVLALVGPAGNPDASALIGAVDMSTGTVLSPDRAAMYAFLLFVPQQDGWSIFRAPDWL